MKAQNRKSGTGWVQRASELTGFTYTVFMTDAKGDYVRVDFNEKTRSARLTVEDRTERCVHSQIENGKIVKEWSSRGNVPDGGIVAVFSSKAAVYSSVTDLKAYNLIRGNYGIIRRKRSSASKRKHSFKALGLVVLIVILLLCAAAVFLSIN
jgi:hypothetical protein